jgi:tripartite-type tricarboxylate transporter receptor subunit TctC
VKQVQSRSWNAITAPPRTPRPIIEKLNAAINELIASEPIKSHFVALQLQPEPNSPAEAAAFVAPGSAKVGRRHPQGGREAALN